MIFHALLYNTFRLLTDRTGVVLLGCGGDLNSWVDNTTTDLCYATNQDKIPSDIVWNGYQMETTGGRIDIVLFYKNPLMWSSCDNTNNYHRWINQSNRMIPVKDYSKVFHKHHTMAPINASIH